MKMKPRKKQNRETRTDGVWDLAKLKQSKSNSSSNWRRRESRRRGRGRAFNDKTTAANDYDVFMEFYTSWLWAAVAAAEAAAP